MEGKTILLVDNRDSFTWNLAHDLERAGAKVVVRQAAECRLEDADGMAGIVLSPGPGLPSESEGDVRVASWAPRSVLGCASASRPWSNGVGGDFVSWRPFATVVQEACRGGPVLAAW